MPAQRTSSVKRPAPASVTSYSANCSSPGCPVRAIVPERVLVAPESVSLAAAAGPAIAAAAATVQAIRALIEDTHNLAEGAGAAPLAALMQERGRMQGKRVGLILSGGNVDRAVFAEVLAGRTPRV